MGSRIDTIDIPYTVQSIGAEAFSMSWLTHLDIPTSVTEIGKNAFWSSKLEELTIPDSITELKRGTFYNCGELKRIDLPGTIISIGEGCFQACRKLETFYMPDSVETLGFNAFRECKDLREIHLSKQLTEIPEEAFALCENLETVNLPAGVTKIKSMAFWACESLTGIALPQGLEHIGSQAFASSGLIQVELPDSLEFIGTYAFDGCRDMIRVVFRGDCPNRMEDPYAEVGEDPYYYLIVYPLLRLNEHAVAYYPSGASGWTEENRKAFDPDLTWASYTGEPPALPIAVADDAIDNPGDEESSTFMMRAGVSAAGAEGNVTGEKTAALSVQQGEIRWSDEVALYTAEFTGLQPGRAYTVLAVDADGNLLENLVYLTRSNADSSGNISVSFAALVKPVRVFVSTAPWKDISDAEVTFGTYTAEELPQTAIPKVVWGGEELTIGIDFMLTGDAVYTGAGRYYCAVQGIGRYVGRLDCYYEVLVGGENDPEKDPEKDPEQDPGQNPGENQNPNPEKPVVNPFTDVYETDYYYDPVLWAVGEEITKGVTPTTFAPGRTCTRAEVVTFLWRSMGCPEPKMSGNPFKDVAASEYYYKAVMWAVEEGITKGTSKTEFSPSAFCRRYR